jgi:hypothetical protein
MWCNPLSFVGNFAMLKFNLEQSYRFYFLPVVKESRVEWWLWVLYQRWVGDYKKNREVGYKQIFDCAQTNIFAPVSRWRNK